MTKITCPYCKGEGGRWSSGDGWTEFDECPCCDPNGDSASPGLISKTRLAKFRKAEAEELARVDAEIDEWEEKMRKPCPKCSVALIDHASREGEPCKSIKEANREYLAEKNARAALSAPSTEKVRG